MIHNRYLITIFCLVVLLGSFGCAREPSESEIKTAIQNYYKESLASAGGFVSADLLPKISNVKKIDCVKATDKGGFNCDVEIYEDNPFTGSSKKTQNIRFIKTDTGWRISS